MTACSSRRMSLPFHASCFPADRRLVAMSIAAEAGAKTVDLTSRPRREPANRLYQRMGFDLPETNVYRYDL